MVFTVHVPEAIVIVPLLVSSLVSKLLPSNVVVGEAPIEMEQPVATTISDPELVELLLLVIATVPPSVPVQVMVLLSPEPVPSNVMVIPVKSNVPFWVKLRSIVIAVPVYVVVAPDELVKDVSLISQPVPEWVIVPSLLILPPSPVTVHAPEAMVTVPLLSKGFVASVSMIVVGLAPREMLQPEATIKSPSLFLVITTVPPRVPAQVTVESSPPFELSNVTVIPVKSKVPLWVKLLSTVIAVPAYVIVPPLLFTNEPSLMSHPVPEWVIVPLFVIVDPSVESPVCVHVPLLILMVPLFVKTGL